MCLGVFRKTGSRTYKVYHPSWSFDANGILVGIITLRETVSVDAGGNSYHGSFRFELHDLSGNLIGKADGTLTATRITPD